eukprot:Nk52_evm50s164 gene=Nk52_evmTU50s164
MAVDQGGKIEGRNKLKAGASQKKKYAPRAVKRRAKKYVRGEKASLEGVDDKKLKDRLGRLDSKYEEAAIRAAKSEVLLTEEAGSLEAEGMERTYKFTQKEISDNVDIASSRKAFDLDMDTFGAYSINYTRNGKYLLYGGERGHVSTMDWKSRKVGCELHLRETVRDVKWLHNETMFAVAQKKYVYIYDNTGMEIHCLRNHIEPTKLEFLPYHFLLASIGNSGFLKYQDTSTGQLIVEHRTKLGKCDTMTQNPWNAVIHLGHYNGTVTLWSPNMSTPLVKMLTHRGGVKSIAVDNQGKYMATSGMDGQMKIWDVRTYKTLYEYYTPTPASHLTFSQTGMLGVGFGPHVQVWKDSYRSKQQSPYMTNLYESSYVNGLQFCPFEDVLGVGHKKGFGSLVIPGSGEANFDAFELNPYQTTAQRKEDEVKKLLEKIQPELICLNPGEIGRVNRMTKEELMEARKLEFEANNTSDKFKPKYKMRGKSSAQRRFLRKQVNVIDANKELLKKKLEQEKEARRRAHNGEDMEAPKTVLDRFGSSNAKKSLV